MPVNHCTEATVLPETSGAGIATLCFSVPLPHVAT